MAELVLARVVCVVCVCFDRREPDCVLMPCAAAVFGIIDFLVLFFE